MDKNPEIVEAFAAIAHEQWSHWSKAVSEEVAPERRARWETCWVPYEQLPEETKEFDRIWARKYLELLR